MLGICDILMRLRIRIPGSVPLTNESGSGSPTLPDPLYMYTQVMQGNLEQNYLHVSLEVMACGEGVHNLELLQLGAVIGVNGQRFFYPASPHQVRPKIINK